jgi:hypothetical protein
MMETRTSRPVTVSLSSANREFNRWLQENGYARVVDKRGHAWQLESRIELLPHPINLSGSWYRLIVDISCSISAESLTRADVLNVKSDARLLSLFGSQILSMRSERILHECDSVEKLRNERRERVARVREFLLGKDFSENFRACVGRWVNGSRMMTYRLTEADQNKINLEV